MSNFVERSVLVKKKILVIILFIIFALPIPIAILGALLSFMWFLSTAMKESTSFEIFASLVGVIVGATYLLTYIFALIKTSTAKKISIKTFLPIVHCLVAFLFLLSLNYAPANYKNTVLETLSNYDSSDCYYSDGFQDYTNYCKYYYFKQDDVLDKLKNCSYFKNVKPDDIMEINSYFDNFEGWLEYVDYKDKYDFQRNIIDTEDYFYIENDETEEEHKYWNYDVYFFDVQTKTLFFIHNNI